MAWLFGDSFDFYSTQNDMLTGSSPLWGSIVGSISFVTGRFPGSRAMQLNNNLISSSFSNSSTIFLNIAVYSVNALSGSAAWHTIQLFDGSTVQCSIYWYSDGSLRFYHGTNSGTLLATFSSAFAGLTWTHFQIKVILSSTGGEIHVRINGAASDTFVVTGLNTISTVNSYTNSLAIGSPGFGFVFYSDDFYCFNDSGAAPNNWQGDVTATQLMVASDPGSPVFSKFPNTGTSFSKINEVQEDGDTTYISDNNVNAEDDFGITALTSSPSSIVAVVVKAFVKKSNAGSRSGDIILKSGVSSANFGSTALSSSYGYLTLPSPSDPNTSAAWTQSNLNAITIGPKVTA